MFLQLRSRLTVLGASPSPLPLRLEPVIFVRSTGDIAERGTPDNQRLLHEPVQGRGPHRQRRPRSVHVPARPSSASYLHRFLRRHMAARPPLNQPARHSGHRCAALASRDRSHIPGNRSVVTYNGWPLYAYISDTTAGVAVGQGLNLNGGYWYVIRPDGQPIVPAGDPPEPELQTPHVDLNPGPAGG